MKPYYQDDACTIYHGDCLEIMSQMDGSAFDLIATDPPYFKVLGDEWDNNFKKSEEFVAWIGDCCAYFRQLLAANGSLYLFAWPKLAARIECEIAKYFNILNCITWSKPWGWSNKAKREELRAWYQSSERIIFAEHYGADNMAKGEAGYVAKCDELRGFVFEPLRAYLDGERQRAGVDKADCNAACGFSCSAGGMASRHYFSRSQWHLPTKEHYASLRALFNSSGAEHLRREYEDLRREYEDLRREYEDLRREYEDLRRPFSISADEPHLDVWTIEPEQAGGKYRHPARKPLEIMWRIIKTSSKELSPVLDPFMGSGTTLRAAKDLGRKAIGIEIEEKYCEIAARRLEQGVLNLGI